MAIERLEIRSGLSGVHAYGRARFRIGGRRPIMDLSGNQLPHRRAEILLGGNPRATTGNKHCRADYNDTCQSAFHSCLTQHPAPQLELMPEGRRRAPGLFVRGQLPRLFGRCEFRPSAPFYATHEKELRVVRSDEGVGGQAQQIGGDRLR